MVTNRRSGNTEMPVRRKTTSHKHREVWGMWLSQQHQRAPYDKNLTDKLQEEETKS